MIRPGEEVHFVALLNEQGETLATVPLTTPIACPDGAQNVKVDVRLDLTLHGKGKR